MGRVLLVIAHQDDEVFILSRIMKHIELNDTLFVVWTSLSYQKGKDYKVKRINESLNLMNILRIPNENLHFLKYPDARTHEYIDHIYFDLYDIIKKVRPDVVYVSAFEGGHIDHDVANLTTFKVIQDLNLDIDIYEFPEYSSYNTPFFLPFRTRAFPDTLQTRCKRLSNEEFDFIIECWNTYKSQYYPLHLYIRIVSSNRSTFGYEYLRKIPKYNYLNPHAYGLAYERFLSVDFEEFQESVEKLIQLKSN